MTALGLVVLTLTLSAFGTRWLERATWAVRAPGLGILAWQSLTAATLLSVVLVGVSLAVPEIPATESLLEFFHACSVAFKQHYTTPGGVLLSTAGGLVALLVAGRFAFVMGREGHRSRQRRAEQDVLLRLVCHRHAEPDVMVLEHATPAVYCLPGRRPHIVVTRGAVSALSTQQLQQVIRHERAHIRARHHVAILAADAMAAALFGKLGSTRAREQIAALAEMHADDAVPAPHRRELADALVMLAAGPQPAGALAATGGSTVARVERLAVPLTPVTAGQRVGLTALAGAVLCLPLAVVAVPAVTTMAMDYCPLLLH